MATVLSIDEEHDCLELSFIGKNFNIGLFITGIAKYIWKLKENDQINQTSNDIRDRLLSILPRDMK